MHISDSDSVEIEYTVWNADTDEELDDQTAIEKYIEGISSL